MPVIRRGLVVLVGVVSFALAVAAAPPAFAAAPSITSFSPTSGPIGTKVTVVGTGFVAPVKVTFAGVAAATVTVTSAGKLTATVPAAAGSGPVTVTSSGGTATSATPFTVTPGVTVSPVYGPPTTATTVSMGGFGAFEAVDVYLDTTDTALVSASGNGSVSTTVTIPATAAPGMHWITAVGRHSGYSGQASFLVRTNWAQSGGGAAHRGLAPYENRISPSTANALTEAWRLTGHESQAGGFASPAVVNGVVYAGFGDGAVVAANATTGAVTWTATVGAAVQSGPAVSGGRVFVGSDNGNVYALNAATGAVVWQAHTGGLVRSAPTVVGSTVYVGSLDDEVYAFDTATGAVRWAYLTNGGVLASPSVVSGVVYASAEDGSVYALKAADGTLIWQFTTGGPISGSPAVVNGRVYVASADKSVYSLRASSGLQMWSRATGGALEGGLAVAAGRVYVTSDDGDYYAFDATTGSVIVATQISVGAVVNTPVYANGVVFAGIGPYTQIMAGGSQVGSIPVSTYFNGVVVADGAVYLNDFNTGELVRYDLGVGALAVTAPAVRSLQPDQRPRAR